MPTADKWTKLDELCLLLHGLTREEVIALREWAHTWRIIQAIGKATKWIVGALGILTGAVTAAQKVLGYFH